MNIKELQNIREYILLAWYRGMVDKKNAQYLIHWLNGAIEALAVKHEVKKLNGEYGEKDST